MKLHEIMSEGAPDTGNVLYRWVDLAATRSYIRSDSMKGRWKHYLPKQLSGLGRSKFVNGLSFGVQPTQWRGDHTICFVIDRSRLQNSVAMVNGQSVYTLSQAVESWKSLAMTASEVEVYLKNALEDSANDPDEAFVIGDIAHLSTCLIEIKVISQLPPAVSTALQAYCQQHSIRLVQPS